MKALQWFGASDVRLTEIDAPPAPAPGEVQIRVLWCGICGTDIEEWRNGPVFIPVGPDGRVFGPRGSLVLGHEVTGEVAAVGDSENASLVGARVAVDGLAVCGRCSYCTAGDYPLCDSLSSIGLMQDGGLAEYVNVPAYGVVRIADSLGADAAVLAEPLSVGIRALRNAGFMAGQSVAVIGAGSVGLLTAQAARELGAGRVAMIARRPDRAEIARQVGVEEVITGLDLTLPGEFDIVVEASGNSAALEVATALLQKRGTLVLVGIYGDHGSLDLKPLVLGERRVIGSLSHSFRTDFPEAVALLNAGRIVTAPIITSRVPLEAALDAFNRIARGDPDEIKAIISPDPEVSR